MTPEQLVGYLPAQMIDDLTGHSLDEIIRAAYRQGYSDHARSVLRARAEYGGTP